MTPIARPAAARPDANGPARLLVITGLSGAGRTSLLKALEDLGYETIDNMPVRLMAPAVEAMAPGEALAVGVDVRFCSRGTPECGVWSGSGGRGQVVGVETLYTNAQCCSIPYIQTAHTVPPSLVCQKEGERGNPAHAEVPQRNPSTQDRGSG